MRVTLRAEVVQDVHTLQSLRGVFVELRCGECVRRDHVKAPSSQRFLVEEQEVLLPTRLRAIAAVAGV